MPWNPGIIAKYEERTVKLKDDVPILEGIMSKKWGKEDELKQLKSDLAALDRKFQAEIAPKPEQADGIENKKAEANTIDAPTTEAKKSMVAEPEFNMYRPLQTTTRSFRTIGT